MGFLSGKNNEGDDNDVVSFIFYWKKSHRATWNLIFFLLFSTLVHGSGFYLFQVVYPQPVRIEPTPDQITILDFSNPAVRSTIQRVKDRTVFLHPPSEGSNVRVKLSDHAARLTPFFIKEAPVFLPPIAKENLIPPPSDQEKLAAPEEAKIQLLLSPNLQKRGIAPWSILREYLKSAEGLPRIRVKLSVLPDGKIKRAEVSSEDIPDSDRTEFNRAVESTLRFRSLENSTSTVQGWVEIRPESE